MVPGPALRGDGVSWNVATIVLGSGARDCLCGVRGACVCRVRGDCVCRVRGNRARPHLA